MARIVTVIRPTNPDLRGLGFGLMLNGRVPDEQITDLYRARVEAQIAGYTKALADLDSGAVTIARGRASEV